MRIHHRLSCPLSALIVFAVGAVSPVTADDSSTSTLGLAPPDGAVVLFDGSNFDAWKPFSFQTVNAKGDQKEIQWKLVWDRASGKPLFDLEYQAARFTAAGYINENDSARVTIRLNGKLIHDNFKLSLRRNKYAAFPEEPLSPIVLQEHGSAVKFRNVWLDKKATNHSADVR